MLSGGGTELFLAQFVGRGIGDSLRIGANVDGLSGATASAQGLVEQLNAAAAWLDAHPVRSGVIAAEGKKEL